MSGTLTWFDKYMGLASQVASWSKDPSRKIGAVAVGNRGQILSQGYNGFPREIKDTPKRLNDREIKYRYVVHAEQNCIYNATLNGVSLEGSDLYVHGLPVCNECAKGVIQVGIKRVYMCYDEDTSQMWKGSSEMAKDMFKEAGIYYEETISRRN